MAALAISFAETGGKLLMGLLAAHDKRIAEAKAENSAVNAALAALIHDCQVIAAAFNDGSITPAGAIQACADVDNWYWIYINPYTQYKNASPAQCSPNQFGDNPKIAAVGTRCWQSTTKGTNFTAASYIGCNIIDANLGMLRAALISLNGATPGTTKKIGFCGWPSDKYGLTAYSGFDIILTVPKSVTAEEVTLSQSGILSVGSAPSQTDTIVEQGLIITAQPDTGKITLPASGSTVGAQLGLSGVSGTTLLLVVAGLIALVIFARR